MKHSCPELKKLKMENYDNPPHYFSPRLKQAPDSDELILTVLYYHINEKDPIQLGWGMRFSYCPACGKCLKKIKKGKIYKINQEIRASMDSLQRSFDALKGKK